MDLLTEIYLSLSVPVHICTTAHTGCCQCLPASDLSIFASNTCTILADNVQLHSDLFTMLCFRLQLLPGAQPSGKSSCTLFVCTISTGSPQSNVLPCSRMHNHQRLVALCLASLLCCVCLVVLCLPFLL